MADNSNALSDDSILPFQLDRSGVRGRVIRVDQTLEKIINARDYPAPIAALIAEATMLTALIGSSIKIRGRLSMQVRGNGAVTLIATDYFAAANENAPAEIRAYASYDDLPNDTSDSFKLLGEGLLGMIIDHGNNTTPYQGIVPLSGGSISASTEVYFAQSEQIATKFKLAIAKSTTPDETSKWRGGGVMLQMLPQTGGEPAEYPDGSENSEDQLMTADDIATMMDDPDHWNRATIFLETAEDHELIGPLVSSEELLIRLFHEEVPRVFTPHGIAFGCTCSDEKLVTVLKNSSNEELQEMVADSGLIEADCQFCGQNYYFAPEVIKSS